MAGLTLPVGTEIGGYVLQGVLGQGASGTVYQARDADGLTVALKLLHPSVAADQAARQRLRREVELLQRIKAPCVARVFDAETQQAEAFVVTELVEGTSLEAHIRQNGPLGISELAALAHDLASAIATIHQAGVVHRDLKPSNVMLRWDGTVVLIDFGLAQEDAWSRLTGTGLIAGTPGFVAPELLRGADPGPEADQWAAAVLLLSAATGRPPFGKGGVQTVLARVLEGQADIDGIEPNLAALLAQAIHPDPAQRLDLVPLVAALTALSHGEEVLPATLVAPATPAANYSQGAQGTQSDGPSWADQPTTEMTSAGLPPSFARDSRSLGYPAAHTETPSAEPTAAFGSDQGQADPDTQPVPAVVGALWLVCVAVAWFWWPVGIVIAVLIWLARAIWVGREAVSSRQRRRGPRPSDPARTTALAPWYLLRALVGLLPALAVAAGVGVGTYLLVNNLTDFGAQARNTVLVAWASLLVWWGPASAATRQGGRLVLRVLVPTALGRALLVILALSVATVLTWLAQP